MTPVARMTVRARTTSSPSRKTSRVVGSMRATERVTRISAPSRSRLLQRAARELVARDAAGEPEIVLDPRRRPGLAAGRLALDHHGAQSFGRAVHRRREAGRPAADDHGVVFVEARARLQAEKLGEVARCRADAAPSRPPAAAPGNRRPAGGSPGQRVGSSGESGVIHSKVIWLRARNRRKSLQAASQRWPTMVTRGLGGFGGDALQSADALARERADLHGDLRRRRRDGVVLLRLHAHDARRFRRPIAARKRRAEGDRHLAEDRARERASPACARRRRSA